MMNLHAMILSTTTYEYAIRLDDVKFGYCNKPARSSDHSEPTPYACILYVNNLYYAFKSIICRSLEFFLGRTAQYGFKVRPSHYDLATCILNFDPISCTVFR
jgi:hypothetical protein